MLFGLGAYKLSGNCAFIRPRGEKRIFLLYISLRVCKGVQNEISGMFGPGLYGSSCRL